MFDGDRLDCCWRCGVEQQVKAMRRVTESGLYVCPGCDDEMEDERDEFDREEDEWPQPLT